MIPTSLRSSSSIEVIIFHIFLLLQSGNCFCQQQTHQPLVAFVTTARTTTKHIVHHKPKTSLLPRYSSDWSNFEYLDDDDDIDILDMKIDKREYAVEDDTQEEKAKVGATLDAPTIDDYSINLDPLFVPAGSQLMLDEETVLRVLNACREEIGTLFGYTAENRGVGITGGVDFVDMDGPSVIIRLKGRFWHERTTVLDRVANYLQARIPEIIDVTVEDEWQLTQEANEV